MPISHDASQHLAEAVAAKVYKPLSEYYEVDRNVPEGFLARQNIIVSLSPFFLPVSEGIRHDYVEGCSFEDCAR